MSLINQALRKAQRDRAPSRMPAAGAEAGTGYDAPQKRGPGLIIGLVLGIALLMGLVAGLTVVLLQKKPAQTPTITSAPAPAEAAPAQVVVSTPAPPVQPVQTIPAQPAPAQPVPAVAVAPQPFPPAPVQPAPLVVEAPAPVPASPPAAQEPSLLAELEAAREDAETKVQEAATKAAAKPKDSIFEWLGAAKISGVRFSDKGNKAIINGETYIAGDYVDYSLRLQILTIDQGLILFGDENDKEYKLRF